MARPRKPPRTRRSHDAARPVSARLEQVTLRIIGGHFRGRRLICHADPGTRPMKARVREATFNLVGPAVHGMHALDLFAGSGALALEAISRGAAGATMVERHFPTARAIRQNIQTLGLEQVATVITADAFIWAQRLPESIPGPWLVFCSPPYCLYQERSADMLELIQSLLDRSPPESIVVVEADCRLDPQLLPQASSWDVRSYRPATIAIHRSATRE